MQYKVEEKGPLTKNIQVTVPAEEVDAAINRVALKVRQSSNIPGFRKGKAPLGLVEKQFSRDILPEATSNIIDAQVREIIAELKIEPATSMNYDAQNVEKGKEYTYSFTFDAMPEFELPKYDGFAVEEDEVSVEDSEIDAVVDQARNDLAELVLIEEKRKPQDGDIVTLDFTFYEEDGTTEMPGFKAENAQLPIGGSQAMTEFEDVVKGVATGEEGEGVIDFPEDFPNQNLTGKKAVVKVKVHAIHERKLPEVTDEFAKRLGQFENIEAMRNVIRDSFLESKKQQAANVAKKNMVDSLLKLTDFPLPPALLESYVKMSVADTLNAMQRSGKSIDSLGKSIKDLHVAAQKDAEEYVRSYIFLYHVAKAENITVEESDLIAQLRQIAASQRRPFEEVRDEYVNQNMIGALHERIMADKAVQAIYDKATVTYVKPKKADKEVNKGEAAEEKEVKKAAVKKEPKSNDDEKKPKPAQPEAGKSAEKKTKTPAEKTDK